MTAFSYCLQPMGSRDNLLAEPQTPDRKVVSSNPGRSSGRIFFSRVNFLVLTLIWCPYHPLLWQWHVKDPNHSAKSAGGRLYMNTHVCTLNSPSQSRLTMLVCRHSVWTYQEMSSHATHQGTLSHSCLSLLSHWGPDPSVKSGISMKNHFFWKKRRWGIICWTFPQNPRSKEKATTKACWSWQTGSSIFFNTHATTKQTVIH